MSTPVHAQSISSLNALLSNPPQYPRNPTHQVHEPLVLYIVRVPGSKDVFLTPLKPPTKASISIEAVRSSLYFLHVERPEDQNLRDSLEATRLAQNQNTNVSPIQRKPLPPTPYANYPASQRPPTPPKSYPHYQPPLPGSNDGTQVERHLARGANLRFSSAETTKQAGMQRKPVGARPMPALLSLDTSSCTSAQPEADRRGSVDGSQNQFSLTRKPVQSASPVEAGPISPHPITTSRGVWGTQSPTDGQEKGASTASGDTTRITLIRRDPASGTQWNVGSLIHRNTTLRDKRLGKFEIELNSPGYTKFAQLESPAGQCFSRNVDYVLLPNNEIAPKTRQRSNSSEFFANTINANTKKPRHAYSFTSPWQGLCSFSNGLDGKSLRCRHTLPSANVSIPAIAADIAELRFNLAWSILRPKDANKQTGEAAQSSANSAVGRPGMPTNKEQWRRSFQVFSHRTRTQLSHSESSGEVPSTNPTQRHSVYQEQWPEEEGRLDLGLGREKAGGGFKGHSAKLGKLIIEDEGLKMCDLVVAACMGVWWQHYASEPTK
ncbi:hypothetical protein PV05_01228 [Exophiala xenobiotica]|uniref:Uncharacterized protein n=1 Tax=Exophiala xenobiotica TaxID=348802 RepID=A0A0D2C823_9EURO|nr:uncharacterized protein PV05_01228 [Exophiala xenobiotica]KIW61066.1 hypothetical protein PV05_01228 [Exophiala xenobiotica]